MRTARFIPDTARLLRAPVLALWLIAPNTPTPRTAPAPLQPYVNSWLMTFHGDDGSVSPPQLWEDRLDTVTWHGRPALQRVQVEHRLVPVGGFQRWTNVFDPNTLAPYMTEQRQRNGMFTRREFDGLRVREIRSVAGRAGATDSTMREYSLSAPFIDFYGGMYAAALLNRQLVPGQRGTFQALLTPDTMVTVPFAVLGTETVRGVRGVATPSVKVEVGVTSGLGASGGTFTAWLIDRPPYVLRLTTKQASPPGLWSWDETP